MEMTEIERMWNDHLVGGFPQDAAGAEVDGVDLVETDIFMAGCICTFLGSKGVLDIDRVRVLRKCVSDLERILSELNGEASGYFVRLHQIGHLVLNEAYVR
jgi:hypothetical protein